MLKPILVVLAAGMGSRYGGLKQMDKIGKAGEAILDYSAFDALRAGFGKIVFVIRHDIEADFKEIVLRRMGNHVPYDLAFQELDSLVSQDIKNKIIANGRTKPWGTAHALLCAKDKLNAPFGVINADDFYGRKSYEVLAKYLSQDNLKDGAIVPYKLEQTLSPAGTVTRGVCSVKDGVLCSVEELLKIQKEPSGIYNTGADGQKKKLDSATPVSMNFWGFPLSMLSCLQEYFDDFLREHGGEEKSECYLPIATDSFIKKGKIVVQCLQADSNWFGVTYKEDRESAAAKIVELTKEGVYPPSLWA